MPTFNDLVIRVRQQLAGYTRNQDPISVLEAPMASSDTTFTVETNGVRNLSRGIVEIDDELVLVRNYDATSGVANVMGGLNGRGYEGTTAAAHATDSFVISDPPFPRARIKEAINDTIVGLYPDLVVFGSTEITKLAPVFEYELPADCKDVWYVTGQLVGPTKIWQPMTRWRFNPSANTADFPSGKSIQIFDFVTPGRAQRVVYAKAPTALSSNSDDFAAVTGFDDDIVDLVIWGACARVLPAYEAARLQQTAVEATERAELVPTTSAVKTASYYQQLYLTALAEERRRMFEEFPQYQHFQS